MGFPANAGSYVKTLEQASTASLKAKAYSRLQGSHLSLFGSKSLHGLLNLLPCLLSTQLFFFQDTQLSLGPVILLMCLFSFLLSCCSFCGTAGNIVM